MQKRFLNAGGIQNCGWILLSVISFLMGKNGMSILLWFLAALAIVLVIIGTIKAPSKRPTYSEMKATVESRSQYLLPLKQLIEDYIARTKILADDPRVYDPLLYRKVYGITNDVGVSVWVKLISGRIIRDNQVLREIEDDDEALKGILSQIKNQSANIEDGILKKRMKALRNMCHAAYSGHVALELFKRFCTSSAPYEGLSNILASISKRAEEPFKRFNRYHNNLNLRIATLLEGAEDE